MVARSKAALINKIVQNFAARNGVEFPRQNCRKSSIADVVGAIVMPVAATEKFTVDYKGKFYARAKGAKDHKELSDKLCGKHRPRKLNRILGTLLNDTQYDSYHKVIKIYNINKGLFKLDNLYKLIEQYLASSNFSWEFFFDVSVYYGQDRTNFLNIYTEFINYIGEDRAIHILTKDWQSWELRDFLSQWYPHRARISIDDKELNTIRKLHDYISREYRKIKDPDFNLLENWDDGAFANIDNLKVGDLTIVVPKTRDELVDWGGIMSNCVVSYSKAMYDVKCLILGIKRNDELIYNLEIEPRTKRLIQFKGKRNTESDPRDRGAVVTVLSRLGYINKNMSHKYHIADEAVDFNIEVYENVQ